MLSALALGATLAMPGPNRLMTLARNVPFPARRAVKEFNDVRPGFRFDEVIPSWNVGRGTSGGGGPEDGAVKVEMRVPTAAGARTPWMSLGQWSLGADWTPRESQKGQSTPSAKVSTDTLVAKIPIDRVDVRLTLTTRSGAPPPSLKHLSLTFSNTKAPPVAAQANRAAWGRTIDVPQRAQGNYPRGGVLCSATSTSMLLWHYSQVLDRPELNRDVPEVESRVWDRVYNGAGNWPFNAAYAGSFDGMLAYVARLDSIADLETLIAAGYPVACSVSFDRLRGRPLSAGESGHLIVLVGFAPDGTPVVNDPAFKEGVRKTYPRQDFLSGWDYSDHTVYIYIPEGAELPKDPKGQWTIGRR